MEVHAGQPEGRRDQHGGRPVRALGLAVEQQRGVELPDAPALEHRDHGAAVDAEQLLEGPEIRRRRDHAAHVEVAVGPAVEAPPHALGERVVHRRVAERALEADRHELAAGIEEAGHTDHGAILQQRGGVGRVIEVDAARAQRGGQRARQRLRIHLEAEPEGGARRELRQRLVKPQRVPQKT